MEDKSHGKDELPDGFERQFWKIVFLLNVGPVALSIAFYLAVFRGTSDMFWAALGAGVAATVFAARSYRSARSTLVENRGE